MELTWESAISPGGMVGHASYLLLVISMMMRNISLLRILVIASAFVAIGYDWFWLKDPVGVFWESILVIVNIIQLLILYWGNLTARFTDDETQFLVEKLPDLSKSRSRILLDAGQWKKVTSGEMLTRQGEAVRHLIYVSHGTIDIMVGGKRVSQCGAGDFIGEITILSLETATATTLVKEDGLIWQIEEDRLGAIFSKYPDIKKELDASFARNFKDKIAQTNFMISNGMVS